MPVFRTEKESTEVRAVRRWTKGGQCGEREREKVRERENESTDRERVGKRGE